MHMYYRQTSNISLADFVVSGPEMCMQCQHKTPGMHLFVMTKALKKEPPADVPRPLGSMIGGSA